jgi:hypothetical protein
MALPRLLPVIVACALPWIPGRADDDATAVRQGWQQLALVNASEAQRSFAAAREADPASREARLGAALALLQLRSRTPGHIADATELLENLRRESPDDDTGIGAAYYLARIPQLHRFEPDRAAAVAGYRALIAAHPGHPYAQLAAPKLALLLLYDDVPPAEWERRVAEIEALLPQLTSPEAARDTRLTLGTALIRLRHDHARAYPLFAACLEAGSVTRMPRLNTVLVQAAESAEKLGHREAAAGHYAEFLRVFPNDAKSDEIRRRLATLPAPPAPTPRP